MGVRASAFTEISFDLSPFIPFAAPLFRGRCFVLIVEEVFFRKHVKVEKGIAKLRERVVKSPTGSVNAVGLPRRVSSSKGLISPLNFLEFVFGFRVFGMAVWVVLHSERSIGLEDLFLRCPDTDSENLVRRKPLMVEDFHLVFLIRSSATRDAD